MWKSCLHAPHSFDRHLGVWSLQPLLLISLIVQITNKVPFNILQPGSKQPWLMTLISEKIRSKIRDVYDFIPIPVYHPGWILCPQPPRPRPCPDMVLPWRWCVTSPLGCNEIRHEGLNIWDWMSSGQHSTIHKGTRRNLKHLKHFETILQIHCISVGLQIMVAFLRSFGTVLTVSPEPMQNFVVELRFTNSMQGLDWIGNSSILTRCWIKKQTNDKVGGWLPLTPRKL